LFHIPLLWAVIITGLDVLLLLGLQRFGMRTIEARPQRAGMKGDGAADVLQEIREAQAEHPHAKRFVRRRGRLVPENPALEVAATAVAIAKAR